MSTYCTLDDVNDYFTRRVGSVTAWGSDETKQTTALEHASRIISALNFSGCKSDEDQVLEFPRGTDTEIPQDVKDACAEIALALMKGIDPDEELAMTMIQSDTIGNVKLAYRDRVPEHILVGIPSPSAWRMLKPFVRNPRELRIRRHER